jgi:hypothetical protein
LAEHSDYTEMWQDIADDENKPNKLGSFTAQVWQQEENTIVVELERYFREVERLVVGV